jgi:hypothetical protein
MIDLLMIGFAALSFGACYGLAVLCDRISRIP